MTKKLFGFDLEKSWDYENGFHITSPLTRISKLLAHYELYKSIVGLPGQVIECGVYKGASLIRFLTFREILENPHSRKIIGFDSFGKFPKSDRAEDSKYIDKFEADGGDGISTNELIRIFKYKGFKNYDLIEGDILETVPNYLSSHPALRISLLHIDVDVYKPTKAILRHFYERIVKGGIVVLDDYSTVSGETKAVEEFFENQNVILEKLPISHIPAYIRKK